MPLLSVFLCPFVQPYLIHNRSFSPATCYKLETIRLQTRDICLVYSSVLADDRPTAFLEEVPGRLSDVAKQDF